MDRKGVEIWTFCWDHLLGSELRKATGESLTATEVKTDLNLSSSKPIELWFYQSCSRDILSSNFPHDMFEF